MWVNFPRLDDLENTRECYHQVSKHCKDVGLPFIDVAKIIKNKSVLIDDVLRDTVHTTPFGGQLYANILEDFLDNLDVNKTLCNITLESNKLMLSVPEIVNINECLLPNKCLAFNFELQTKKKLSYFC